ncbi:MAG TPA: FG-GAP-like repeat-containing protein [Bacteroidia bacterium]|jgi:hypothetical protein|nr:FG-GAP-like repeat-containing protein [Bacteroidia bacterium]
MKKLLFFLILAFCFNANAQVCFNPLTTYTVGSGPEASTSADFNGDSIPDLAIVNSSSYNIYLLLGTGAGSFNFSDSFAVGVSPVALTSADLNGDGKIDLAVANSAAVSNSISILLGNGMGSFGVAPNFSVSSNPNSNPISIVSSDFNGDGLLDLATANYGSDDISVLLNIGNGNFGAATTFSVGSTPYSIISSDFDGDGKMDLAVANYHSSNISVLLGTGTGSFNPATNFTVGTLPRSLTSSDFDGDGKLDLAVTNYYSNTISILLGTGTGGFDTASNISAGGYNIYPNSIINTDFNKDGLSDLAVSNNGQDNVSVLLGLGTGNFRVPVVFAVNDGPVSVISADFDRNNSADLAVIDYGSDNLSILLSCATTPTCNASVSVSSTTICAGSSSTLTASGATTYNWAPLTGLSATNGANIVVNPTVTTTYTVTGNSFGCLPSVTTLTVTINSLPDETGEIINPSNCGGSNGTITGATGTGGSGNYGYEWNNAGGFVSSSSYTNGAGTYPLQIKDNVTGCVYTKNFTIPNASAPAPPTITASSSNVCVGQVASFSVAAIAGTTYNWTDAAGGTGTGNTYIVNNLSASPNPFTVMATATNMGCTSAASTATVSVNTLPVVAVNSAAICLGSSATLQATGASTYTWTPASDLSSSTGTIVMATPSNLGVSVYTVTGTSAAGCVNVTTASVTVNPPPPAPSLSGTTGSFNSYCQGSSVALTVNSGSDVAVWYYNNTVVSVGSSFTPSANYISGTYVFSVIDSSVVNGCVNAPATANTFTVGLTVNPTLTISIISPVPFNPTICDGASVVLTPSGATSYTINPGNLIGTSFTVSPTSSTTYTIDGTDGATGCDNANADAAVVPITVNPSPSVTYTLVQDAAPHTWDLYPTITGGTPTYSYNWSWGDGSADSTTAYPSHTYIVAGNYNICVEVIDANGCMSTYCMNDAITRLSYNSTLSPAVYVNVKNNGVGIKQISVATDVNIYPNPAQNNFTIEINTNGNKTMLFLFDVNGRLVLNQFIQDKTTIDVSGLNAGVYSLNITNNDGTLTKKLVIVK